MDTCELLACGNQRYHVTFGPRRTTVSLDNRLSLLLSLKLGHTPQTPQAQRAVRRWLQARLDDYGDHNRAHTSQWLAEEAIHELLSTDVQNLYNQWMDSVIATAGPTGQQAPATALATATENG